MVEVVIIVVILLLLAGGFLWTRGAGGMPGGHDDPVRQQFQGVDELGDPVEPPWIEHEDREHEIE